jgi:hypothetical protein
MVKYSKARLAKIPEVFVLIFLVFLVFLLSAFRSIVALFDLIFSLFISFFVQSIPESCRCIIQQIWQQSILHEERITRRAAYVALAAAWSRFVEVTCHLYI